MAKRPPTIPDSELDVLKVLWDRGQATVRAVLEALLASGRGRNAEGKLWSYATAATLLERLEAKGLVASDRRGLAFVYAPRITAQEVRRRRVDSLVDRLYQGEPGLLVLHLLESHPLEPDQARAARRLLEEMTGGPKGEAPKPGRLIHYGRGPRRPPRAGRATRRAGARVESSRARSCLASRRNRLMSVPGRPQPAIIYRDLDQLQVVEVEQDGKRFLLRSEAQGTCGSVFQAAGMALPPTVRQVPPEAPGPDAAYSATPPG